jgi:hypothetical protein
LEIVLKTIPIIQKKSRISNRLAAYPIKSHHTTKTSRAARFRSRQ